MLVSLITSIFSKGRGVYGHRRVHAVLKNSGHHVGLGVVASIMREQGLIAVQRKAYKRITDGSAVMASDLIGRGFTADQPGTKFVGDITYIKTGEGWLYVATAIDLYSKKVAGYSMAENMHTDLICDALTMVKKRGGIRHNAIFHSDRGSQYTSDKFTQYCDDKKREGKTSQIRLRRSMGRTGVCYDNALAESFFGALKNELIHHQQYATRQEAKTAIFEYIEVFYNRQRSHSGLGYLTPQQAENQYHETVKKPLNHCPEN